MSGFVLKAVVIAVVIALLLVIVARAFRRVKPSKAVAAGTPTQRMPMLFPLVGAVLLALGFVMALASFASRYTHELLPMRIASIVLFVAGVCTLLAYRNWSLEVGADAVRWRTVFGRDRHLAFTDIASCRTVNVLGRERVVVRTRDGQKLSVDARRYDMSRVIAASSASS